MGGGGAKAPSPPVAPPLRMYVFYCGYDFLGAIHPSFTLNLNLPQRREVIFLNLYFESGFNLNVIYINSFYLPSFKKMSLVAFKNIILTKISSLFYDELFTDKV